MYVVRMARGAVPHMITRGGGSILNITAISAIQPIPTFGLSVATWGGVIGIWPRHKLVDGTETTQPEFSFWFQDVGWAVENYGTDPEIDVDNAPQDAGAGRDRQLETALEVALQKISAGGVSRPDFGARPRLAPAPLPKRR